MKRKDLFELIKQDGVTQSQVDEKNDALNKAQKNFQNKFKDYSKAMNTVNKENKMLIIFSNISISTD